MEATGDAAAWYKSANHLIAADGMEAHDFMLLSDFAAPLYHFTGEPGATFVHGMTRRSGSGMTTMLEALKQVDKTNTAYPNSFGIIMYVAAKSDEIVEIFKNADRAKKTAVADIMRRLDPSGAGKYNALRN